MAKLKGLSLFANVGVAEAGIENIEGIEILLANEIDHKRCLFYSCVHPNTKMVEGDITDDEIRASIVEESKQTGGLNFE
jgi:DNA (cytosine-5)-methyltransferase 1